jgi:hypothetical protein
MYRVQYLMVTIFCRYANILISPDRPQKWILYPLTLATCTCTIEYVDPVQYNNLNFTKMLL